MFSFLVFLAVTAAPPPAQADAAALNAEGWQLWQAQNFSEAATKFAGAVEQDPKLTEAWNGLGWARFNGGEAEAAVEAFEKCIELEPKHPAALNGLGQIHLMWREYDAAEKYLKKASPSAQRRGTVSPGCTCFKVTSSRLNAGSENPSLSRRGMPN